MSLMQIHPSQLIYLRQKGQLGLEVGHAGLLKPI